MALTEGKIQTHLSNIVWVFEQMRQYAAVNAENFIGHWRDVGLQTDFPGDFEFGGLTKSALDGSRAQLDATLRTGSAVAQNAILEYGRFLDFPERDISLIFERLRKHFVDNTLSIDPRNFTFPTPSAGGGNVGDGSVSRMNVDADGVDLENQWAEAKRVVCIRDENSGSPKHEEVFQFEGAAREIDSLEMLGSGLTAEAKALSAQDSLLFIQNPSFESFAGSLAAPTNIPGWTLTTGLIGALELSEANTYRGYASDGGTPRALVFDSGGTTSVTLKQQFALQGAAFDPNIPYFCQLAYNRQVGSGDGTLTLKIGGEP